MKYNNFSTNKAEEIENEKTIKLSFPKNGVYEVFYEGPLPKKIVNEELKWIIPNDKSMGYEPKKEANLFKIYNGNPLIRDRINIRVYNRIEWGDKTVEDLKTLYKVDQWGKLVDEIVDSLKSRRRLEEDDEGRLVTLDMEKMVLRKVFGSNVEYKNFENLLDEIKPENQGEAKEILNRLKREDMVVNRDGFMLPSFLDDLPSVKPRKKQQVVWEAQISKTWFNIISRIEICLDGEVIEQREGKNLSVDESGKLRGKVDLSDFLGEELLLSLVFKVATRKTDKPVVKEINREIRVPPFLEIFRPEEHKGDILRAKIGQGEVNQIMDGLVIQTDGDFINLKEDVDWSFLGEKAFTFLKTGSDFNLLVGNRKWPGWIKERPFEDLLEVNLSKVEKPGEFFECRVSVEDPVPDILRTDVCEMVELKVDGNTKDLQKESRNTYLSEWEARKHNYLVEVRENFGEERNTIYRKKIEIPFPEPMITEAPREVQVGETFQITVKDKSESGYTLSESEIEVKSEDIQLKIKQIERKNTKHLIKLESKSSGRGKVRVIYKVKDYFKEKDYASKSSFRIKVVETKTKEEIRSMTEKEFNRYSEGLEEKIKKNWVHP